MSTAIEQNREDLLGINPAPPEDETVEPEEVFGDGEPSEEVEERAGPEVIEGWALGEPPEEGWQPYAWWGDAEGAGEAWWLYWAPEAALPQFVKDPQGDIDDIDHGIDWPFDGVEDDGITREDLAALGFLDPEADEKGDAERPEPGEHIVAHRMQELLPVPLSYLERAQLGGELAEACAARADAEDNKKADAAKWKRIIDGHNERIADLVEAVTSGHEKRMVPVEVRHDVDHCLAYKVRLDTGKVLDSRAMTPKEYADACQQPLPLEASSEEEKAEEAEVGPDEAPAEEGDAEDLGDVDPDDYDADLGGAEEDADAELEQLGEGP